MDQLRVHNWDKWQTYRRDRGQPPWIKVHREVSRHFDWLCLSDAQRGQLLAIWILAADRDGMVPADPKILQRVCGMSSEPDVNMMIDKGFLDVTPQRRQLDATVTPGRRQRDAPDQIRLDQIRSEENTVAPAAAVAAAASSKEARDQEHLAKWEAWRAGLVAQAPSLGVSEAIVGRYMAEAEAAVREFYERRGGSFTPRRKSDLARRMSKASPWAQLLSIEQYVDGHYGTKDERYLAAIAEKRVNVSEKELEAEQDKHRHNQKNRGLFADITGGK